MSQFNCYVVSKGENDQVTAGMTRRDLADLPDGEVLIRVAFSSLNYKDALAATGRPGVARKFPHVPGIDAAGEVAESRVPQFQAGQKVLVTGYDLGAGRWGGWAEYVRVPAEWVIPLPEGLSLVDSMRLGTAGFTAALSVDALQRHEIGPDRGEIVVTGSTGGVGCLAVRILARLGYSVVAVTGKQNRHDWLRELGAKRVIGRQDVDVQGGNPLLKVGLGRRRRHGRRQHAGDDPAFDGDRRLRHGLRTRRRDRAANDGVSVHSARRHPLRHRHGLVPPRTAASRFGATSPASGSPTAWPSYRRRSNCRTSTRPSSESWPARSSAGPSCTWPAELACNTRRAQRFR